MDHKKYALCSGIVFLIVFIMHGLRVFLGWEVIIGGWEVPMWFSWVAIALTGFLAYTGLKGQKVF